MTAKSGAERQRDYVARKKLEASNDGFLRRASKCKTKEEFWEEMRKDLDPETLAQYQELHGRADDMAWLTHSFNNDPKTVTRDYAEQFPGVDVAEDIYQFIEEHRDYPHLGYIHRDESIPPNWSDGLWWRNVPLFDKLCAESPITERYVRYGLLGAIPDHLAYEFLLHYFNAARGSGTITADASQKAAEFVGWRPMSSSSGRYVAV